MAYTAHKSEKEMEEIIMSEQELGEAVKKVAALVREAEENVKKTGKGGVAFFQGAGLSHDAEDPNCFIQDYRSKDGFWTQQANPELKKEFAHVKHTPMHLATPGFAHRAVLEFQNRGLLAGVASQNVDALTLLSGLHVERVAELHGNGKVFDCNKCGKRHFVEVSLMNQGDHSTNVGCSAEGCSGHLADTIINFGENLQPLVLESAYSMAKSASLHICLGSSLKVSPANDLPRETRRGGGKVVIVNLQRTPLDENWCDVRVHAKIATFFRALFQELKWEVPDWTFRRTVTLVRDTPSTVRFLGVQNDTSNLACHFGTIDLVKGGGGQTNNSATAAGGNNNNNNKNRVDYTYSANALQDLAPRFELASPNAEATFHCAPFYAQEKKEKEPIPLEITLPAGVASATFFASFTQNPSKPFKWEVKMETAKDKLVVPSLQAGAGPRRLLSGIKDSKGNDYSGFFSVQPRSSCEHCSKVKFVENAVYDVKRTCETEGCGHNDECMTCMECNKCFCGRHVNGHMVEHFEKTKHSLVLGHKDLSIWCNSCECYINPEQKNVAPHHRLLYRAKFGEEEPCYLASSAAAVATTASASSNNNNNNNNSNNSKQEDEAEEEQEDSEKFAPLPDQTGFSVQFYPTCPHMSECKLVPGTVFDANAPCNKCPNTGENWMCATCGVVACSRYVKGHFARDHKKETGHSVGISLMDCSVYCLSCDKYIADSNPHVAQHLKALAIAKKH